MRRLLLLLGIVVLVAGGGCQAFGSDGFLGGPSPCQGVEATMCSRLLAEIAADRSGNISSVAVRCATGSCDPRDGEVTITVDFADGTHDVRNIGWDGAALPVGFPTVPTCEGIKVDACIRQAANGWGLAEAAGIVRIHVRCEQGQCGPNEGTGVTRLTFRDGRVREEGWAYASAPEPAPIAP